ncbi:hypothetical protein BLOT_002716 [Blomia tropicalis]|nr:hypothetical protein BLOT_002716 [Blomia tropicalis]
MKLSISDNHFLNFEADSRILPAKLFNQNTRIVVTQHARAAFSYSIGLIGFDEITLTLFGIRIPLPNEGHLGDIRTRIQAIVVFVLNGYKLIVNLIE